MKQNINLTDILKMCLKHWLLVLAITVVVAIFSYIYSIYFATPMYSSSGQLNISNRTGESGRVTEIITSDLASRERLAPTFIEIMKNDTFLNKVKNMGNFDLSVAAIRGMVTFEQPEDTSLINISVRSTSAKQAYLVAQEILKHAPLYLESEMGGSTVKTIQEAELPTKPYSPNVQKNVLVATLCGLFLGVLAAVTIELLDKKISSSEGLEEKYGYPILGEIPNLRGGRGSGVY